LTLNRDRYPELVNLTLDLATLDALGTAARAGATLPVALDAHRPDFERVATSAPQTSP